MADGPNMMKSGLAPIARSDARLVILGSLPGDASLAARRYYAHPTNQFWRLVGSVIGEDLAVLDYEQRLERLGNRGIALWDVIGSASRRGSLDQAIRSPTHNPLADWLAQLPAIEALAFNGTAAAAAGRRLLAGFNGAELIDLPSSSAANTMAFSAKAERWSVLARYCRADA
jgi:hypoxanthine-DNA glycosylase